MGCAMIRTILLNADDGCFSSLQIEDSMTSLNRLIGCENGNLEIKPCRIGDRYFSILYDRKRQTEDVPVSCWDKAGRPCARGNLLLFNRADDGILYDLNNDDRAYLSRFMLTSETGKRSAALSCEEFYDG